MVEKYSGRTPDGKNIGTWYHLSRKEVLHLIKTGQYNLEQGKTS